MNDGVTGSLPCPSTYCRLMLRRWVDQGGELLEGSGLTPENLSRMSTVTVRQQLRVLANARRLAASPNWALDLGRELGINCHGSLGFAALSARTVAEGLDVFAQFTPIRAPYVALRCVNADGRLTLVFDTGVVDLGDLELPMIEILAQVVSGFLETALRGNVAEATFCFRHAGRGYADRYATFLDAQCRFDCEANEVRLPASFAAIEIPTHDAGTFATSVLKCREALDALVASKDVVARVRHMLVRHFDLMAAAQGPTAAPRLEAFAKVLGLTPRTLIRRLAERGIRFSQLRSDIQLDLARKMLLGGAHSIGDIAHDLGYGSTANFGRAFRKQTGLPPSEFRRQARHSGLRRKIDGGD